MPVIIEKYDSRETTVAAENPSAELIYIVDGTENDTEVHAIVQATIPAMFRGLVFQSYTISHKGSGLWEVSVRYGTVKKTGESSFSFDTGGGTAHITQSLRTVRWYAAPGRVAPNFGGAIGVNNESVEGTDITIPVYNFKETHYIPVSLVTPAYKATLFYLTGKVNAGPFKGFAPGEVLFLGASGSQRGQEDWEITFSFAASPNVSGLTIGNITGISKLGWEYLWVRYEDAVDARVLVKQPAAVYIEQVYPYGDFSGLGIGT